MDKSTVTRTFSIGGVCSGAKAKEDLSSNRRHSSTGIRALLWATSSSKSLGNYPGSDSQQSWENIFPNILTPDSIPQFTIPSLSVQNSLRSLDREAEDDDEEGLGNSWTDTELSFSSSLSSTLSSSTSSSGCNQVLSKCRAEHSLSEPLSRAHLQREGSTHSFHSDPQHCLDPVSRAALSLPHLAKVTTSYGFITLSQSPQMVNEEALLCQAGARRHNKDKETACCLSKASGKGIVDNKGSCSHLSGDRKKCSKDSIISQNERGLMLGDSKASSATSINATVSSSSTQRPADRRLKRHFYNIIRKHFPSPPFGMK